MKSYSFEVFPRKYLLQSNNNDNKPITQNTYLNWLRSITNEPEMTNDLMRSSYITWFYNNHKRQSDRDLLATKMRHTSNVASRNYFKDLDESDNDDDNSNCEEIKGKNEVLQHRLNMAINEANGIIDDKLFNKRRSDALYSLNNRGVAPRKSTLEKYRIVFDPESKRYVKDD